MAKKKSNPMIENRNALICLDSWAGRREIPCQVIEETPKRYRVFLKEDAKLPNGKSYSAFAKILVPKSAIRFAEVRNLK